MPRSRLLTQHAGRTGRAPIVSFSPRDVPPVEWRDLTSLSRSEIASELCLSLPWLVAELVFLQLGWWPAAAAAAFYFFLTGLRQVHGGFHLALGLDRRSTTLFLFVASCLMLGSMRAVRINHLRHHRFCLEDEDVEGAAAHNGAWRALALGPLFPLLLHAKAIRCGSPQDRLIIGLELAANVAVLSLAGWLALACNSPVLVEHLAFMSIAQCLTRFFAVWTVHHDCDVMHSARTQRGKVKNAISYEMFFHLEHHLYPAVPQRRLATLAARLDRAGFAPKDQVF